MQWKHVVIICPICGQFHWHGTSDFDINKLNYSTRVPHCTTEDIAKRCDKDDHFYSYELIADEETIRREKILPKDLTVWRARQRSARWDIEKRWKLQKEADRDERILEAVREIHSRGVKMAGFRIAILAEVSPIYITEWMSRHGICYLHRRYQVVSELKASPELCEIFGKYEGC